jgi:hypothetical protein
MEPTHTTNLSHGFGRAFLEMMPRTTVCGGWTSFCVQPDSDEMHPPAITDAGLNLTRDMVEHCAEAARVRLASADTDAVLAIASMILQQTASQIVAALVQQVADPRHDSGAVQHTARALGAWSRESVGQFAPPLRSEAARLAAQAAAAGHDPAEGVASAVAQAAIIHGSHLIASMASAPAVRHAMETAAGATIDEERRAALVRIVAGWMEVSTRRMPSVDIRDEWEER